MLTMISKILLIFVCMPPLLFLKIAQGSELT